MNKQEFLTELKARLSGMPQDDIDERLAFYIEMIDDRIEEGISEEDAVSEIGSVEEIVSQIVSDIPFSKIVKEKVRPKRALKTWEFVLLVLGSPIWIPLIMTAFAVFFTAYLVVWSLIFALWAVEVSFIACSLEGIISCVVFFIRGGVPTGFAMLGVGVFCSGLSILLFFGCKQVTKYILRLTKKMAFYIKSLFIGREDVK